MNTQELYDKINQLPSVLGWQGQGAKVFVTKDSVLELVRQLDEPQKVTVPKVAIDYYEKYKNQISGFDEWFGDFYDSGFLEEFPDGEKLAEWLYNNTNEVNRQRELALANLIVNGPSAVEVEREKLYTVEIPDKANHPFIQTYLAKNNQGDVVIFQAKRAGGWVKEETAQLTEAEIKRNHAWSWPFAREAK